MLYEWDEGKRAWFPRIDEDFMASYQMNYGFTPEGKAEPTRPDPEPEDEEGPEAKKAKMAKAKAEEDKDKEEKPKTKANWFEEDETK